MALEEEVAYLKGPSLLTQQGGITLDFVLNFICRCRSGRGRGNVDNHQY